MGEPTVRLLKGMGEEVKRAFDTEMREFEDTLGSCSETEQTFLLVVFGEVCRQIILIIKWVFAVLKWCVLKIRQGWIILKDIVGPALFNLGELIKLGYDKFIEGMSHNGLMTL